MSFFSELQDINAELQKWSELLDKFAIARKY